MERTYSDAVKALNTLQSNFAIVDAIRKSGRGMNKQAIPEMIEWCSKVGYQPSDFDRLNIIHVAGTKGKGSTSAFISSILSQYLTSTPTNPSPPINKIGLYTSPHLRFVRERIQINNAPLSESLFARYFFEVWDRLEASARKENPDPSFDVSTPATKPIYFRFLTLMALHTYLSEGVDTVILECGIGGEYDSTNIITRPTVTGITTLGIDHVAMLGSTLPEIAWHKAGIMKPSSPCFTVPQPEPALEVLKQRAAEKNTQLTIVPRHPALSTVPLGLAADFQKTNASLAIAISMAHLRALKYSPPTPLSPSESPASPLPDEFVVGLSSVHWPGRCEIRPEPETGIRWHLDGGHTVESIDVAASWFGNLLSGNPNQKQPRILLFNQQTRERDPSALARELYRVLASSTSKDPKTNNLHPFTHAIFTTNITYAPNSSSSHYAPDLVSLNTSAADVKALRVQKELANTWKEINGEGTDVRVCGSIEEAVKEARNIAKKEKVKNGDTWVLATGSLHLVGGLMEVLESQKEGALKN
ncbi:MAG: Folylpolyglutamate synthetase [Cirrosporium novae-zelandiae]|nr:MAG: Folylpolyglutamate synthetase [Cirrosporium novae-zelandiae]